MDKSWEKLAEWITQSPSTVFFGGAGVSTESGIPDFRSETGLYSAREVYGYPPETLLSHTFFMKQPEIFFRYYKEKLISQGAKPNAAHTALAALEGQGKLTAVITQNIDGLHQAAGSQNVLELHGSNQRQYCVDCGGSYRLEDILAQEGVPFCQRCGGIIRPDVVLYEEPLNSSVIANATAAIAKASLLIVGGTSLTVYPAAGLLQYFHGNHLVIINQTPTKHDHWADLVIHVPIGEVLSHVVLQG